MEVWHLEEFGPISRRLSEELKRGVITGGLQVVENKGLKMGTVGKQDSLQRGLRHHQKTHHATTTVQVGKQDSLQRGLRHATLFNFPRFSLRWSRKTGLASKRIATVCRFP
ncbi:MAG: hypothetical protein RMM98_17010, partial [Acidobacteriota bacterium]|nr:hypothetical protein [Acidobacteriota bacterium]